jgi:hypothetical protein
MAATAAKYVDCWGFSLLFVGEALVRGSVDASSIVAAVQLQPASGSATATKIDRAQPSDVLWPIGLTRALRNRITIRRTLGSISTRVKGKLPLT